MDDRRAGALRIRDRLLEESRRRAHGARVRRVVEVDGRRRRAPRRSRAPSRRPGRAAAGRARRRRARPPTGSPGSTDRAAGSCRRAARATAPARRSPSSCPGRPRPRARGRARRRRRRGSARDRLAQPRQPAERRVAVHVRPSRGGAQRLDDVRRRPDLGVPAAEVDDRRPLLRGRGRHAREQSGEVLRRKPLEPVRTRTHREDRTRRASKRRIAGGQDVRNRRRFRRLGRLRLPRGAPRRLDALSRLARAQQRLVARARVRRARARDLPEGTSLAAALPTGEPPAPTRDHTRAARRHLLQQRAPWTTGRSAPCCHALPGDANLARRGARNGGERADLRRRHAARSLLRRPAVAARDHLAAATRLPRGRRSDRVFRGRRGARALGGTAARVPPRPRTGPLESRRPSGARPRLRSGGDATRTDRAAGARSQLHRNRLDHVLLLGSFRSRCGCMSASAPGCS